jgi:hypothetical protein
MNFMGLGCTKHVNFEAFLTKFSCKSKYILIVLEETNTAVYTYVVLNLIERSGIEFKGLGGARNMWFRGFFDECSRTIENFHAKVYILIVLEETNTAVYTYVVLSLIKRLYLKGLGVHETCDFEAFFDECSRTICKIYAKVYIFW